MYDLVEADDGHEGDDEVGEEAADQHACPDLVQGSVLRVLGLELRI